MSASAHDPMCFSTMPRTMCPACEDATRCIPVPDDDGVWSGKARLENPEAHALWLAELDAMFDALPERSIR